jgi:bacterioferritin
MSNPNQPLIDILNDAQALELAGIIQYLQHSLLVTGPLRVVYQKLFHDLSKEAHEHAVLVGDKIVSLGGLPTVEPRLVRHANTLQGMLSFDIDLEVDALAVYLKARAVAESLGLLPYALWLEEHITEEQGHIEELNKLILEQDSALSDDSADDASASSAG